MKTTVRLLSLLIVLLATATAQNNQVVTFYGTDPIASIATKAFAINDLRQIAGTTGSEIGQAKGFVWSHGEFQDVINYKLLPSPHLFETHVFGINNFGQTVGIYFSDVEGEGQVAFVRDRHGISTALPPVNEKYIPHPLAISDSGLIAGWFSGLAGDPADTYGFVRFNNGNYQIIAYPGARTTIATGVNFSGDIVGYYKNDDPLTSPAIGFIYSRGHFRATFQCRIHGQLESTMPAAINDWGQIVGNCGNEIFVRGRFGRIRDLNPPHDLTPPVYATGINNHGDIVGYYKVVTDVLAPFGVWHSFVIYDAIRPF